MLFKSDQKDKWNSLWSPLADQKGPIFKEILSFLHHFKLVNANLLSGKSTPTIILKIDIFENKANLKFLFYFLNNFKQ